MVPAFQLTWVSVSILIIGILSLYVENFTVNKEEYGERGGKDTALLYRLKNLYFKVKDSQKEEEDYWQK